MSIDNEIVLGYAKPFSNGSEYGVFNDVYCCNCKRYRVHPYENRELTVEEGGCPIADRILLAMGDLKEWPNILLLVKDTPVGLAHVHCPFIEREKDDPNQMSLDDFKEE